MGFSLDDAMNIFKRHREEWRPKEAAAKKDWEESGREKKPGLYKLGGKTIDVYHVENQGWFWGYMSDCGNPMDHQCWLEAEWISETPPEYSDNIIALMNAAWNNKSL